MAIDESQPKGRPQLPSMTISHSRDWTIVLPRVYRYENEEFIDEFFKTGRIRLSSFQQFASYADEQRGDKNEGRKALEGSGKGNRVFIVGASGMSSLVFCTSTRLSKSLMTDFQRNSAFEIFDTVAFAHAISRQLVGFRFGQEGHCLYEDDFAIRRAVDFKLQDHIRPDNTMDMNVIFDIQNQIAGREHVLAKGIKYQHQCEYRLLWELDKLDGDHQFVEAPEARSFCRQLKPSELLYP